MIVKMANASIIGFLTQEKVTEFQKLLGDRFIAIADFPDGVPWAWQDKKLHLTGPEEPYWDGVFAKFGIRNLKNETEALEILTKVIPAEQIFAGEVLPPEFWNEEISRSFNAK